MSDKTADDHRLDEYRIVWERKPVLRAIYHHYYRRIVAHTRSGRTLEIGGGSGNLKRYMPDVVSTDILPGSWLDARADAHHLPFRDDTFDNIVFVDVLHHLERPAEFFTESCRVLRDGGRIVMIEPAITPISYTFYKLFHPEPVMMRQNPLDGPATHTDGRDPFDANQAIPTLLCGRYRREFHQRYPNLRITDRHRLSLIGYPMSGGFKPWCLVPKRTVVPLLRMEDRLERWLGPLMGFRLFVVITYRDAT